MFFVSLLGFLVMISEISKCNNLFIMVVEEVLWEVLLKGYECFWRL